MKEAWEAQEEAFRELHVPKQMTPAMEKLVQERTDQILTEKQRSFTPKAKQNGVYYSPAHDNDTGLPGAICTCGASKYHMRLKVLQQWARRHGAKTGHGLLTKE